MNKYQNRKHPRVCEKKHIPENESIINLSLPLAAGIVMFAFLKGFFWGCVLKKR